MRLTDSQWEELLDNATWEDDMRFRMLVEKVDEIRARHLLQALDQQQGRTFRTAGLAAHYRACAEAEQRGFDRGMGL
jgi:hypothetical protein